MSFRGRLALVVVHPRLSDMPPTARRRAVADATAGAVASLASLWLFYPVDVYKTNRQAGNAVVPSWYAGVVSKTLHTASSSFCYFFWYSWIVAALGKKPISAPTRLLLSSIAAMINTLITLPLDVVSSQQQAQSSRTIEEEDLEFIEYYSADEDEKKEEHELEDMIRHHSAQPRPPLSLTAARYLRRLARLWKGLVPSLLLCSNPAIHYTIFDSAKTRLLAHRSHLSLLEAFALGILAKFVATVTTYPLIRAKVLLMVTHRQSLLGALVDEFREHGVAGLYQGCHLQLLHTLLKSAFLMMMRERITQTTNRMILS